VQWGAELIRRLIGVCLSVPNAADEATEDVLVDEGCDVLDDCLEHRVDRVRQRGELLERRRHGDNRDTVDQAESSLLDAAVRDYLHHCLADDAE
jgi:hypothetical protein